MLTLPPRPVPEEADLRSGILCSLDPLSSGFPLGLSKGDGHVGGEDGGQYISLAPFGQVAMDPESLYRGV